MIEWMKQHLIKLHEWIQNRWLIVSIFMSSSSIWFSLILTFWGEKLHLIVNENNQKNFTFLGLILTIAIVLFSALLIIAQRYYEYYTLNTSRDKRKLYILENVNIETNKICDNKFITLRDRIWKIKKGTAKDFPHIISNPCEQLKHIIEKMSTCLCKLLSQSDYDIDINELYISLYYNFPLEDDEWRQTDSLFPERGLSIDDLLNNPQSTFSKILNSNESLLFFNSNEQARKQDSYIRDGEDIFNENNELQGSIACYKILIRKEGTILIQAVLSITTYTKQFVNKNDKKTINNVKYNMTEHILNPFSKRINIELCLLYLYTLYQKNKAMNLPTK